jgi:polyhydroxybutyrate depolymerase
VCSPGSLGERRYLLCRPERAGTTPAGLVLALHGRGSSVAEMQAVSGLEGGAAARNLAVAYAEGLDGGWGDDTFASPGRLTGREDVDFLDALVTELRADPGIDEQSVGVVGFSNGASMALRYAAQRPATVRAVVSVAGQLPRDPAVRPAPPAVPLLQVYGEADPVRSYDAGIPAAPDRQPGQPTPTLSTRETVAAFVALAEPTVHEGPVTDDPVPDDGTSVRTERWTAAGRPAVVLHTIVGGGHAWPSAKAPTNVARFGTVSRDLDASAEAIAFVVSASDAAR